MEIQTGGDSAQELLRQKQLLDSIYDTVPCGILRFFREEEAGGLISLNRAAARLLGYDGVEACRADWHGGVAGAVLPDDRRSLSDSYERLGRVGEARDVEYRVRRQDGSIRWLSGTSSIVSADGGRRVLQHTMFDVTESRLLREQLGREQEMCRLAMESRSDAMYEYLIDEDLFVAYEPPTDQEGVLRRRIPHFQQALRRESLVHPDDIQAVIDNICNGRTEVFEVRFRTPEMPPEEGFLWHRITSKRIFRNGKPYRVVGTLRNVHHMRKALSDNIEALHRNQSALQALSWVYVSIFYADLVEGTYYGVRMLELGKEPSIPRSGRIQEELTRYFRTYLRGEDQARMLALCSPESLRRHLPAVHNRLEAEFCHWPPGGGEGLWLRLEIHLISLENGAPKNAVFTFRNVNEERKRELERRREERRARLALEDAYEATKRANLAKSNFLSRMSHDMRTPMNAIMGLAAIGERCPDDRERVADCLKKIQLSGAHLLSLINDVLDMTKIESGKMSLEESAFHLPDLARAVGELIRPDLERKNQHFCLETGSLQHEAVCGDPTRIRQILLNLLSNAVKYTPDGGHISLTVRERPSSASGVGCYLFLVEDDGIGMSEAFQERLFQPFERSDDDPRISAAQGTGLGMSITWNLVQMMNGSIEVDSRLNAGSRFTVTLYLKLAEDAALPVQTDPPAREGLLFHRPWRILLVEDTPLNREIARALLEMASLRVEEASNGLEALEAFRASPPGYYHLILMDIQMPVMDGYAATRSIRALDRPDAGVPIIALTANAFTDDVRRSREAGISEHLSKPLEVERLMGVLKRWLEPPL